MGKQNDSWGIEVGASALKAVRLVYDGEVVSVADYEVIPFKMPLVTPDLDADEQIQVALDQFLSQHETKKSTIVVSVPGHAAFARFAKLPPVDPKKIAEIVRFEAAQQVPFPIEQVEWDYQTFQGEDSPDVEVGIFAITKERLAQFLSNYRQAGLKIDGLTMSPLAVFNGLCYDLQLDPKQDSIALVDIGTTSTDVIICDHGAVWIRTLQIGGNDFTEALMRAFKVSYPKAEKLKREARTSKYARQIFQAMRPVFADLVQELQRSLGFYQSMNRDAEINRLIGVGSTFRLPGLQKFLKQQLNMEVIRPSRFERLAIDGKHEADFAEHAVNMATAYGLAIQGLGLEWLTANLLPKQIVRERIWKSKQPWFAAAAGLMAASVGVTYAYQTYLQKSYEPMIEQTDQVVRPVLGEATKLVGEWRRAQSFKASEQEIKNLVDLFEYRDLWPKILRDINDALAAVDPQPALLTNDIEAISQIPRRERRRFYVTDLSATFDLADPVFELSQQQTKRDREAAGQEMSSEERRQQTEADERARKTAEAQGNIPRMIVTLEVATPLDESRAIELAYQKFFAHLKSVQKRPDWPYEYLFEEQGLKAAPGGDTINPYSSKAMQEGGGGMMHQMRASGMVAGVVGSNTRATTDRVEDILPIRPILLEPDASQDRKFILTWKIDFLPVGKRYTAKDLGIEEAPAATPRQEASVPGSDGPAARGGDSGSSTMVANKETL